MDINCLTLILQIRKGYQPVTRKASTRTQALTLVQGVTEGQLSSENVCSVIHCVGSVLGSGPSCQGLHFPAP